MREKILKTIPYFLVTLAAVMAFLYEPIQHTEFRPNPPAANSSLTSRPSVEPKQDFQKQLESLPFKTSSQNQTLSSDLPPSVPAVPVEVPPSKPPEEEAAVQVISSGPTTFKQIALTFDDGPKPKYTLKILDILRERNVKATFFVLGECVRLHGWILRQIVAEGHEIGNHTYSHLVLKSKNTTEEMIEDEITRTQNEIKNSIGYETFLFRPPYGAFRPQTKSIFHEHHFAVILWSIDTQDWRSKNSDQIFHAIVDHVRNGSIILCHDIQKATMEALPKILDALLDEGYEFTTVSQLCGLPPLKLVSNTAKP